MPTGRDPSFRWGDENMKAVGPFGLAAFFFFITPDSFRVHGVTANSRWMDGCRNKPGMRNGPDKSP